MRLLKILNMKSLLYLLCIVCFHQKQFLCDKEVTMVPKSLAAFVSSNFAKPVTITCRTSFSFCGVMFKYLAQESRVLIKMRLEDSLDDLQEDFQLVVLDRPCSGQLRQSLRAMAKSRVQSSLLFFQRMLDQEEWTCLKRELASLKQSSHFYIAFEREGTLLYHTIISLKDQTDFVISEMHFQGDSSVISTGYNLQGMRITSISDTWIPYVRLGDCIEDDPEEEACEAPTSGLLMDMCQLVAEKFNFTIVSLKRKDGKWGVLPEEGTPNNLSGSWVGVMGDVIFGKYPLSINMWNYFPERHELLDFVHFSSDQAVLALTPQPVKMDTGMFLRPFTRKTWYCTGAVALSALTLGALLFSCSKTDMSGTKIYHLSVWYCFIALNAYYGGAFTMFFITNEPLPFNSVRDAIRAYPEWNLIIRTGRHKLICSSWLDRIILPIPTQVMRQLMP